jgi:hypothetical protein
MITAVEIENFKGIRERVRIELKPITLLFGPNSGGKSTILHALNYAREVFLNHTLDLDHIRGEVDGQRLGGFRNFVHKHDLDHAVLLRFEFIFHPGLSFGHFFEQAQESDDRFWQEVLVNFEPTHGSVEVSIQWNHLKAVPYVATYRAKMVTEGGYLGGEHEQYADEGFDVGITCNLDRQSVTLDTLTHIFRERGTTEFDSQPLGLSGWVNYRAAIPRKVELLNQKDALPDPNEPIAGVDLELPGAAVLSKLVLAPYQCLRLYLEGFRWLAGWRDTPPRPILGTSMPIRPTWTGGLAAWYELLHCSPEFIDRVNGWLTDPERLDLGYALLRKTSSVIERGAPIWHDLINGRAFESVDDLRHILHQLPTETRLVVVDQMRQVDLHPQDVGMGVLHLVPVVVASLAKWNGLIRELWGFDEPELHTHPRVQAALGDLLIEATHAGDAWADRKVVLVATHSEHLLLRLLRRIREGFEHELPPGVPKLSPDRVSVIYVESPRPDQSRTELPDGSVRATQLRVDETGEFVDRWPHGFFEDRAKELF